MPTPQRITDLATGNYNLKRRRPDEPLTGTGRSNKRSTGKTTKPNHETLFL